MNVCINISLSWLFLHYFLNNIFKFIYVILLPKNTSYADLGSSFLPHLSKVFLSVCPSICPSGHLPTYLNCSPTPALRTMGGVCFLLADHNMAVSLRFKHKIPFFPSCARTRLTFCLPLVHTQPSASASSHPVVSLNHFHSRLRSLFKQLMGSIAIFSSSGFMFCIFF